MVCEALEGPVTGRRLKMRWKNYQPHYDYGPPLKQPVKQKALHQTFWCDAFLSKDKCFLSIILSFSYDGMSIPQHMDLIESLPQKGFPIQTV